MISPCSSVLNNTISTNADSTSVSSCVDVLALPSSDNATSPQEKSKRNCAMNQVPDLAAFRQASDCMSLELSHDNGIDSVQGQLPLLPTLH